jgi:hypothetical protein
VSDARRKLRPSDHFDCVDLFRAVHQRGFGLLSAGTADDHRAVSGIAPQVMRGEHATPPELEHQLLRQILPQPRKVAVEGKKVRGLRAAVVGNVLAAAVGRRVRPRRLIEDGNLRDWVPCGHLETAVLDLALGLAFVVVQRQGEIPRPDRLGHQRQHHTNGREARRGARRRGEQDGRDDRDQRAAQQQSLGPQRLHERKQQQRPERGAGQIHAVEPLNVARCEREDTAETPSHEEERRKQHEVKQQEPAELGERLPTRRVHGERDRIQQQRNRPDARGKRQRQPVQAGAVEG